MRKCVITGANGFVGKRLVELCVSNGFKVYAIVHNPVNNMIEGVRYITCSLNDINRLDELIDEHDIDVFFHFAWEGTSGAKRADEIIQLDNVKASAEAVRVAKQLGCSRFVYAGSIMEYEVSKCINIFELLNPNLKYSLAKLYADNLCKIVAKEIGIEYVCALISNIYGPGEQSKRLIYTCLSKAANRQRISLSPGNQIYDFIYIDDAVRAILMLGEEQIEHFEYYIGSREQKPLKIYMQNLARVLEVEELLGLGDIEFNGIELNYREFDCERIYNEFEFSCQYSFEEGIKKTYDYVKEKNNG